MQHASNKPVSLTVWQNPVSNKDTKRIFCQNTHIRGDSSPVWLFPNSRQTTWQVCDATMRSFLSLNSLNDYLAKDHECVCGSGSQVCIQAIETNHDRWQAVTTAVHGSLNNLQHLDTCILWTEHLYILHMIKKTKKKKTHASAKPISMPSNKVMLVWFDLKSVGEVSLRKPLSPGWLYRPHNKGNFSHFSLKENLQGPPVG